MEFQGGVAEAGQSMAEFLQGPSFAGDGHGDLQAFAEVKGLEGGLRGLVFVGGTVVAHQTEEVAAQVGQGDVIADVQSGKLFGEFDAIQACQDPLREVVGEALGNEMEAAEGLEGVVEDGRVTAALQAIGQFPEIVGLLVADLGDVRSSKKTKRLLGSLQGFSPLWNHDSTASCKGNALPLAAAAP